LRQFVQNKARHTLKITLSRRTTILTNIRFHLYCSQSAVYRQIFTFSPSNNLQKLTANLRYFFHVILKKGGCLLCWWDTVRSVTISFLQTCETAGHAKTDSRTTSCSEHCTAQNTPLPVTYIVVTCVPQMSIF